VQADAAGSPPFLRGLKAMMFGLLALTAAAIFTGAAQPGF
jgi:hypothetical protein